MSNNVSWELGRGEAEYTIHSAQYTLSFFFDDNIFCWVQYSRTTQYQVPGGTVGLKDTSEFCTVCITTCITEPRGNSVPPV